MYEYNSGLQAQGVVHSSATWAISEPGSGAVLLDPNALSADGTVSLATRSFSRCGTLCAYGLSASGSDWVTGRVLRVAPADGAVTHLPDVVERAKFTSFAWTADGAGFFYARYPDDVAGAASGTETVSNTNHQIWYHRLGTPQAQDAFCFATPEGPTWILGAAVSEDGRFLWLTAADGCDPRNKIYYVDLQQLSATGGAIGPDMPVVKLVDDFGASWDPVCNDGAVVTLQTNLKAPRYRLLRVDIEAHAAAVAAAAADGQPPPGPDSWTELVPQRPDGAVLEWATAAKGDALLMLYAQHAQHALQLHSLATGAVRGVIPTPIGSVRGCSAVRAHSELFITFVSFLDPGVVFRLDLAAFSDADAALDLPIPAPTVVRRSVVAGFDPDAYETRQEFVESADGTKVPLFIVHAKGLPRDGSAPALLYGYGGFNISLTPSFSTGKMAALRSYGGSYAVACLRGGGEFGEEWHKAGSLARKQNVFDDFTACARFLVKQRYTQPSRLAIEGGSNGGLLVAAVANQAPELFGAAVAHVGVMDMLRFHRFTIGHAWVSDYGCADASEAEFKTLRAYSPLHNVTMPKPALMLLTGDHDDRVVPLHSLKLAAALQHAAAQGGKQLEPILARVDTKSGHGAGKSTQKVIEEAADVYAFVAKATGSTWHA